MQWLRHTHEQVIIKCREAETMLVGGRAVAQVLQYLGISEPTVSRWQDQYGGMKSGEDPTRAWRPKELELQNARLKRLVAERPLHIAIRREADDYLGKPQAPCGGGRS